MMWYVMLTMCLLSDRGCLHHQRATDYETSYISFEYFAAAKNLNITSIYEKPLTAARNPDIRVYA